MLTWFLLSPESPVGFLCAAGSLSFCAFSTGPGPPASCSLDCLVLFVGVVHRGSGSHSWAASDEWFSGTENTSRYAASFGHRWAVRRLFGVNQPATDRRPSSRAKPLPSLCRPCGSDAGPDSVLLAAARDGIGVESRFVVRGCNSFLVCRLRANRCRLRADHTHRPLARRGRLFRPAAAMANAARQSCFEDVSA